MKKAWFCLVVAVLWSQGLSAQFTTPSFELVCAGATNDAANGSYASVAISSDGATAIVGVPWDDAATNAGAAWIFTRSGGVWTQQGSKLIGTGALANIYGGLAAQGTSVAISADGNTAIVGGPNDNGGIGAVWVFTRGGGVWSQQSKLVGTGVAGSANLGSSVALSADGNTAIVGGPYDNGGHGAAWIFTRSGGTWTQQFKLAGMGAAGQSDQGYSVALSADGNTAIVGGPGDNPTYGYFPGATWVFTRSGGVWSQQGSKLVGTGDAGGGVDQGSSVALSADGNTVLVGGPNDNGVGAIWAFIRSGGTWSQQGSKLVGSGTAAYENNGRFAAISADGNTAVGAGGAAWVFTRSGGVWTQLGDKLEASPGAIGAVSLSADGATLISGEHWGGDHIGAWGWVNPSVPPPVASRLGFVQQPTTTVAGQHITPAVTVQVQDSGGNPVSQAGVSITLSLSSGTGTLSGTLTQVTNASGIAAFNDLSIDQAGSKQLTAASSGLTSAVSSSFEINASASCAAQRALPGGYVPGQQLQVTIQIAPPGGTQVYAVEDVPPAGWPASAIDNNGQWDGATGKVKWGPFFDSSSRALHYSSTPPANASGTQTFSGTVSINGVNQATCGAAQIAKLVAMPHPADANVNWRMEIGEMTAYGTAWKQGSAWPTPPNPIPIAYVTNAGLLWKSGEVYHYDASENPPWATGASSQAPLRGMGISAGATAIGSGSAVCTFNPTSYTAGAGVQVSIAVTPASGTQVYAVEDAPPSGWAVSGIDNGGTFDSANGKVKWGPFFDNTVRTLDYTVTPPAGTVGTGTFSGTASFDGTDVVVGGARTIGSGGSISYPYSVWVPVASHSGGLNGSQWRSDLGLLNVGSVTANVQLGFFGSSVVSTTTYVPPGAQSILTDVVGQLNASGSGAIEVLSDQPLRVTARTYNQVPSGASCYANGTQGQNYPAVVTSDGLGAGQSAYLAGLIEDASYRCNIGLVNTGTATAAALVELHDGAGAKLGDYPVTLAAGQWAQATQPFLNVVHQTAMDRGYAKITVQSGSGVFAFASVIDNITNDPTLVTMQR